MESAGLTVREDRLGRCKPSILGRQTFNAGSAMRDSRFKVVDLAGPRKSNILEHHSPLVRDANSVGLRPTP
jgi:hypothetical protein